MEHKEVEMGILSFLKARGYAGTLSALKSEAKPRQVTDSAGASDPDNYIRNYESLKRWIINTLEKYRQDLERVLFPAFAYLYLEMVKHTLADGAQEFFSRFRSDHPYSDEIQRLEGLDSLQKLESDVGRHFLEARTTVHLSKYALQLLMSFIESESYSLVFWVLNKYVEFEVTADSIDSKAVLLDEDSKVVQNGEHLMLTGYGEEQRSRRDFRNFVSRPASFVEKRRDEDRAKRLKTSEDVLPSICMHTVLWAPWICISADVSEEGSMVLCGFEDSAIRLWDLRVETVGKKKDFYDEPEDLDYRMFQGHSGAVFAVRFSPCCRLFISASEDGSVRLWSLVSMSNVAVLKGHLFPVWTLAFSLQGYYFASGGADQTARLWVTDSCAPVRVFAGHLGEVTCVKFHPNGLYLGSTSSDKTLRVWDIATASCVRLLAGHCVSVSTLEFSITGKVVVSADEAGRVVGWSLADGQVIWENQLRGAITSISASREDGLLGVTSELNRVCVLSTKSGSVLLDCPTKDTAVLASAFTWRDVMVTVGVYRET